MPRLTEKELKSIRERAEAATPGPWGGVDDFFVVEGDGVIIGNLVARCEKVEDTEFIAHAREDIMDLLEYIEDLKAELSRLCPIGDLDTITTLKADIAHRDEYIKELETKLKGILREKQ